MTCNAILLLSEHEDILLYIKQVHDGTLFTDSLPVSSNLISLNLLRARCTFSSLLHNLDSAKPVTSDANTFGSNSMSF